MFKNLPAVWLVPIVCLASAADAQAPALTSAATQAISASRLTYRSALDGYQPFTDDLPLNWPAANDNVARLGGWRAYAKEAAQPADPPTDQAPARDMAGRPGSAAGAGKP
jgi:hypothetical protein